MIKLITNKELEELNKTISTYFYTSTNINTYYLYTYLLNTLVYYKDRVSELELQIEDLLDRDLI